MMPLGGTDSEAVRALLQDRIALWTFWVFVLSSGFYLLNVVSWVLLQPVFPTLRRYVEMSLNAGNVFHLAASLLLGAIWRIARGVRLSLHTLRRLELVTLVGVCTLYALMSVGLAGRMQEVFGGNRTFGLFAGLLASANTILGRAIFVPSTPRRTLWASTLAMAPMVPAAALIEANAAAVMNIATWSAVSIAVGTVGSRVIFGLRVEADRVRRLGQYTLEDKIGAGGMGIVYRARHAMLRRPTAIKLLPPDRAGESNLARFEREVQLTAELSHPNTVAIYDYGRTPEGVFYYAMEYLDGLNLDDLVGRYGAQPAGRVIAILVQVCGALAEAHGRGLVHRDVKPANIILTERGGEPDVAKVVDFGLVKPLSPDDAGVTRSESNVLTGTPLYMSPEALSAPEAGDPRSDLYALGAVAYFLVTGHPVFESSSVFEIIGHHLHTVPVPPSQRTTNSVPADLEALILRCLEKQPDDRPRDAHTLAESLRRCRLVKPWTRADAVGWWRAFRSAETLATGERGRAPAPELTVTVDVGERLQLQEFR
jgi:hypothetical protein